MRLLSLNFAPILLGLLVPGGLPLTKEPVGPDFGKQIELAQRREAKEGRLLLRKMIMTLAGEKKVDFDPQDLARKLADALPRVVKNLEELTEVLGPPKQVSRQIFYRRYREQRVYEFPLRLVVVLETITGQEAKILIVQPLPSFQP